MTTTYERPQQKMEQQFASGTVNTFTPTLNACIFGPVYEMVSAEASGAYVSQEKEFDFLSVNAVDLRLTDAEEVLYPVTLGFDDATILYNDGTLTATVAAYTFTNTTVAPTSHLRRASWRMCVSWPARTSMCFRRRRVRLRSRIQATEHRIH